MELGIKKEHEIGVTEFDKQSVSMTSVTRFYGKLGNTGSSDVITNPFENCQIFSVSWFKGILSHQNRDDYFQLILKASGMKPQMMIDVNEEYGKRVEEMFPADRIVFKAEYISSNHSPMITYLINVKGMLKNS